MENTLQKILNDALLHRRIGKKVYNEISAIAKEQQEIENALKGLVKVFTEGRNYETRNPYTRPEVKRAMQTLAQKTGQEDWYNVDLSEK